MGTLALVVTCSLCAAQGRRAQTTAEQTHAGSREGHKTRDAPHSFHLMDERSVALSHRQIVRSNPIEALAMLLLVVNNPTAGRQVSSVVGGLDANYLALAHTLGRPAARPLRPRTWPVKSCDKPPSSSGEFSDINDDELQDFNKELYAQLGKYKSEETSELYEELRKQPQYETWEFYSELRQRQGEKGEISPLEAELSLRREKISNASMPNEEQTAGDVIESVLYSLRDVDWPHKGHGVEVLRNYLGPASMFKMPELTDQKLYEYFRSSKYAILLEWVSIQYPKSLELSFDRKRAAQQVRLTTAGGQSVLVSFRLSEHTTSKGTIWLIDHVLVKDSFI